MVEPLDEGGKPVWFRPGAVFDCRHVYFVPNERFFPEGFVTKYGEVLRYDTLAGKPIPTVSEWGLVAMALVMLTAGTLVYTRRHRAQAQPA